MQDIAWEKLSLLPTLNKEKLIVGFLAITIFSILAYDAVKNIKFVVKFRGEFFGRVFGTKTYERALFFNGDIEKNSVTRDIEHYSKQPIQDQIDIFGWVWSVAPSWSELERMLESEQYDYIYFEPPKNNPIRGVVRLEHIFAKLESGHRPQMLAMPYRTNVGVART